MAGFGSKTAAGKQNGQPGFSGLCLLLLSLYPVSELSISICAGIKSLGVPREAGGCSWAENLCEKGLCWLSCRKAKLVVGMSSIGSLCCHQLG